MSEIESSQMTENEFHAMRPGPMPGAPIATIADERFLKMIRTDQAIADDLKARAIKVIEDLNAICSEADKEGFRLVYQSGQDAFGRFFIQVFQLMKKMG